MTEPLVTHDVVGGAAWSVLVRAGRELRLTALGTGVNASVLMYCADDAVDRLNVPDTLIAQRSARIAPPMVLMSDRGTALASVTGSTLDWHDAICGHSTDAQLAVLGPSYAADPHHLRRSARTGLLSELRKHGRGPADLHGGINFFSKVAIGDDDGGALTFVADHSVIGDWVALRAEQDLLVVLSTAPHPLAPSYLVAGVRAEILALPERADDDPSATFCAESARALAQAAAVRA